jgi:hypothetical protein
VLGLVLGVRCREFIILINSDVFNNLLNAYTNSKFKGGAHAVNPWTGACKQKDYHSIKLMCRVCGNGDLMIMDVACKVAGIMQLMMLEFSRTRRFILRNNFTTFAEWNNSWRRWVSFTWMAARSLCRKSRYDGCTCNIIITRTRDRLDPLLEELSAC